MTEGREWQDGQDRRDGIPSTLLASPALPARPALPTLLSAAAFYTLAFVALTWPAVTRFRSHWLADEVDGLQNVWNLWWVQHAVTVLHQNPWHTNYLHYPYGTPLLAHTLNPFNGFIAIGLSTLMSPAAIHNSIVTFGFVGGGVTTFLLARHLTRSYLPSLLAGFIFTFSSFHFAHAEGHLQLVSLEWIPLFLLLWLKLVAKPTVALGVGAAAVLFLVILCDYYYFLYCVIAGAIILGWWFVRRPATDSIFDSRRLASFAAFALVALATSGVLAGALVWSSLRDPLTGAHPATEFSLDLLSPFVYGGHWRFGTLTRPFWIRLPGNIHESSVHLGVSVIALALYAWRNRRRLNAPEVGVLTFLLLFFLVLAFGPTPQVAGSAVLGNRAVLPYAWLEAVFPPLAISGVPIRMMVMVTLCAALLAAYGFSLLLSGDARHRRAAAALACVLLIEYLPRPIPMLSPAVPDYVAAVRNLPGQDAVLDTVSAPSYALFYQTLHQRPMAFGYLAREPRSVEAQDRTLEAVVRQQRFDRLWPDYRLRYVVARDQAPLLRTWPGVVAVWDDGVTGVFDVSTAGKSSPRPAP